MGTKPETCQKSTVAVGQDCPRRQKIKTTKFELIICGLAPKNKRLLHTSANLAIALANTGKKPLLSVIFPHCNSLGLGLMDGKPLDEADEVAGPTAIILENDLFRITEIDNAEKLLSGLKNIITLHHTVNETTMRSDVVLPSGTFAESTGTIVNYEGRAQRYYRVLPEDNIVRDSWRHLAELISIKRDEKIQWKSFDDVTKELVEEYPVFSRINRIIPDSRLRYFNEKIARQTSRFSGRTAITAHINVSEPKPPEDQDSALNFSMEGYKGVPDTNLVPYYWSPGWNSTQAVNNYLQEPGGYPMDGNPGVLLINDDTKKRNEYFKINDQ
jgi:NADH-quinone oxidoreductase subunit G